MSMSRGKQGFTLVELLVVTVLGTIVLFAGLQTLIVNQRTYTAQGAHIQGQQAIRAAASILFGEIREMSPRGGDLLWMGPTAFYVRSMKKFGVVCQVGTTSPPVLRVLREGEWFEAQDSVFVMADNKTAIRSDDTWITARVTAVDTTAACGARPAQSLSFSGQVALFTADSVRVGAPVRSFVRYRYGLISYGGRTYLGRGSAFSAPVPLVGPLTETSGLQFVYLDSLGSVTANRTAVRQIQVTIRTSSAAVDAEGVPISDSITTRVYTRN